MCEFTSGYYLKTGEIICDPEISDSHSELAVKYNIHDTEVAFYAKNFVKFECTPPKDTAFWSDFSNWTVVCDEEGTPDWFDKEKIREAVEKKVRPMFVHDTRDVLEGGCWIFDGPNASVKTLKNGRIVAVINGASLAGANLCGATLAGADLAGADLYKAELYKANLTEADLSYADLRGADLSYANLTEADLSYADLRGADLSYADLSGADLRDANLSGADLYKANLHYANLSWANLTNANLEGADLRGATLRGANLYMANLIGADLTDANLEGAINYVLPEGWKILENFTVDKI